MAGGRVSWFIEGIPILGDFTWGLSVGVDPYMAVATVVPSDVGRLLAIGRKKRNAVTMIANPVTGPSVTYGGLNILHNTNAADPNLAAVVIADRRYWWKYAYVYREINIRRSTGNKARLTPEGVPENINDRVVDLLRYAKFSVKTSGKPFVSTEMIKELIEFIDLTSATPEIQDSKILAAVPFENVTLKAAGDQALAQLLALVAGAEITISNTGKPIVFSWASGKERAVVGTGLIAVGGAMGPEQFAGGHVELVDRGNVRPESITVLVDIESELRFDFIGDAESEVDSTTGAASSAAGVGGLTTPRLIQNVIPIPDFTLTLADGRKVVTGQWLPTNQYLAAITKLTKGGLSPAVTFKTIFRAMVPFQRHLWAALALVGDTILAAREANWSARIGALQRHIRQTWQIPRDWMDRIRVLKNHMVATVDTSRGLRAQSRIYSDHFRLNTSKSLFLTAGAKSYGSNIKGFPGDAAGKPRAVEEKDIPAPADLELLVPELGILRTAYLADPNGNYQEALPGLLLNNPIADKEPGNRFGPVYFNSLAAGSDRFPQIDPASKLAVILTAVPANQLFAITVKPEDVVSVLPDAVKAGIKSAKGPPMFVYTSRETARVAWTEEAAPFIEIAFGMAITPGFDRLFAATPLIADHVINFTESAGGAASLNDVAREIAAKIYAQQTDRVEGAMSGFIGDIVPTGAIDKIEHSINSEGKLQTSASLRETLPEFDVIAMLDPGTQRILLRLVKPQGG